MGFRGTFGFKSLLALHFVCQCEFIYLTHISNMGIPTLPGLLHGCSENRIFLCMKESLPVP